MERQYLLDLLNRNILRILFNKKDGTEREMLCTLRPNLIPRTEQKSDRKINETIVHVYDLEKKDWRSIIIDSIKKFDIME